MAHDQEVQALIGAARHYVEQRGWAVLTEARRCHDCHASIDDEEHRPTCDYDRLRRAVELVRDHITCALEASDCPKEPHCCIACDDALGVTRRRMRLCPKCGNKRCPRASDHVNACTGSNEPGQPGSPYPKPTHPTEAHDG